MASVIHGFIYNKDAFDELGLAVPTTEAEFFAVLDKIKADGTYIPLAMGTKDQWEAATMGYQNIGPNYWKGEEGRLALIKGEQKLTDPAWVEPYASSPSGRTISATASRRRPIPDSQNLFTLGRAAIYPAGSWEISGFNTQAAVQDGRLPAAGRERRRHLLHLRPHRHRASASTPRSPNAEAAKTFLTWVASPEFADDLRQRAAGLLQPVLDAGEDGGSAGAGIRLLARQVQADDPLDLPDPVARHAEPRERDLGRIAPT